MEEISNGKSLIIGKIWDKVENIDYKGCQYGKVLSEKTTGVQEHIVEIKKELCDIKKLLNTGIIVLILMTFIAGGNWIEMLFKTLLR